MPWTGIRPINRKLEAIINMMLLAIQKHVHLFVGLLNYYRDMWASRSHLLHPLTALTPNKVKFKWTDVEQKAVDYIKRAISQDTSLEYLDVNKRFDIHTGASNYHI